MRCLALVLMILLLPLRGWAGDAMATGMAAGQLAAVQTQAGQKKAAQPAPLHDCADMQVASHQADEADSSGSKQGSSMADCGTCPSCQACHTVALSLASEKSIGIFKPVRQVDGTAFAFASADAALSQKPPIP